MRLATWNVNSVKQRVPRLLPWLDERRPDVVCLQETKLTDDAFAELFGRHRDRLARVARRTCAPEDAADALQDAMLAAHRCAPTFRHQCAVGSWLHRIVVNACLDRKSVV